MSGGIWPDCRSRGLKDGSIVTHANTLRSFFAWLELEDVIGKSPMRRIRSRSVDPDGVPPPPDR